MTLDSMPQTSPACATAVGRVGANDRAQQLVVIAAALVIAIISARSYAGSWNDGSRLATVESLVDRHTFVIDDSIFVRVPPRTDPTAPAPYPLDDPTLLLYGTGDRLFVDGHFYSDKSPVPAVLLAGVYQALQWTTGLTARQQPAEFCYWLTLLSSGLAYVVAVWCIFQLGAAVRLPLSSRAFLTASFGLATVALPYVRQVNSHIQLLAVTSALVLSLAWLAEETRSARVPLRRLLVLGTLAGLGYTMDLGVGPVLLVSTFGVVAYRSRSLTAVAAFALAALPWLLLHHTLNYAIGGTFQPANITAEYSRWPGSTFKPFNLTGTWKHTFPSLVIYATKLLVSGRGFLSYNLPLVLSLVGFARLLRRGAAELPEIVFAGAVCVGSWLLYAVASNNYSGQCVSIRWFVPLLAPGYFVIAVFLREEPDYRRDFLMLTAWGLLVAGYTWWEGPWMKGRVPFFLPLQVAALLSWFLYRELRGWQPHQQA
jgi:hypothetical protein